MKKKIHGFWPVVAALAGNGFITLIKFIAFFVSGSSVMFSEAIHSFADTSNQSLLLVGLKKSTKKPDEEYIYGYGRERFFWALISACGIFFIGAGATIYRGISTLIHGQTFEYNPIILVVLAVSFAIEFFTFYLAYRELRKKQPKESLVSLLKNGDPSTLAVLYEDSVA
ncbi:MAG: cation diffusion facilitator family transporter, partial [Patescibacteria group bacterium]|nr:cation diffusion facilitator family transporter [Patescibacteria group bacterium]